MKRCTVGGQAVLEGVMMKTPAGGIALAVRKSDGTIVKEFTHMQSRAKKGTFFGLPIVRGVVVFIESLVSGMKITTRSAEIYGGEEAEAEEPSKFELWLSKKLGKSAMDVAMACAVVLAIVLAVGLFVFLPSLTSQLIPWADSTPTVWKSLTEGLVRLVIFLLYLTCIGMMKDIGRLYQYHGAEHKVIACYEHEADMTPESAMRYTRLHPRCGTNYLFLVMAISILFFALLPYSENLLIRLLTRLIFLPLVAGISYEVLRLAAASDGWLARVVRAPGLALQYLTTREPDPEMLEVALAAFDLAMNPPDDTKPEAEQAGDAAAPEADGREPEAEMQAAPEPPAEHPAAAEPQADTPSTADGGAPAPGDGAKA